MSPEEYEELRSNPVHFAVTPAGVHVFSEAEWIVEKREKIARRPRSLSSSTSAKSPPAGSAPPMAHRMPAAQGARFRPGSRLYRLRLEDAGGGGPRRERQTTGPQSPSRRSIVADSNWREHAYRA